MLDHLSAEEKQAHFPAPFPEVLLPLLTGDFALRARVHELLPGLRKGDADVIIRRFNLDGNGFRTLEESAQELGKTKERVRQTQNQGLAHLGQLMSQGYVRPLASVIRKFGPEFPQELIPLLVHIRPPEVAERVQALLPQLSDAEREFIIARLNLDGKGYRPCKDAAGIAGMHGGGANRFQNAVFRKLAAMLRSESSENTT